MSTSERSLLLADSYRTAPFSEQYSPAFRTANVPLDLRTGKGYLASIYGVEAEKPASDFSAALRNLARDYTEPRAPCCVMGCLRRQVCLKGSCWSSFC